MLTLVAVLLHPPPSALPLCYLLCCSLFIRCSGKDLPWSHWCCLHKRQNSIWCKALWWRHHRMFFEGKYVEKRGWCQDDDETTCLSSLSFNASSCISLISICYWTKSECLLDVWWKNPTVICKRSFPEFTHQTTSKNVVLYEMKHQHWNWTFPETNVLTM